MNTPSKEAAKQIVEGFLMLQDEDNVDAIEEIIQSAIDKATEELQGQLATVMELRKLETESRSAQPQVDQESFVPPADQIELAAQA